jgi:hypothetical protein
MDGLTVVDEVPADDELEPPAPEVVGFVTVRLLAVVVAGVVAVADVATAAPMTTKPVTLSAPAAVRARWAGCRRRLAAGGDALGEYQGEEEVMRSSSLRPAPPGAGGTSGPGS